MAAFRSQTPNLARLQGPSWLCRENIQESGRRSAGERWQTAPAADQGSSSPRCAPSSDPNGRLQFPSLDELSTGRADFFTPHTSTAAVQLLPNLAPPRTLRGCSLLCAPFTCHSFRRQAQTVGSRHCFCRGSVLVLVLFFNEIFMFIFPLSTNSNATRPPHPIFSPSLSFHSSLSPVPDPWHNGPETAPRPGRPTDERSRCTSPVLLPCATTHAHGSWCLNSRCNKYLGNASLMRLSERQCFLSQSGRNHGSPGYRFRRSEGYMYLDG